MIRFRRNTKEVVAPTETEVKTPELTLLRGTADTRVNCMGFMIRRFMRYTEGDLLDIEGVTPLLEEIELSGKGKIVHDPHFTVANSRNSVELAAPLRSKNVRILDIIQGTKRVAAKQPRSSSGELLEAVNFGPKGVGTGDPEEDARHVVFLPNSKLAARLKSDLLVVERYLGSRTRPLVPHIGIVKAETTEDAMKMAQQFNELLGGRPVPIEVAELFVSHSVVRRVPVGLAEDKNAVIIKRATRP